MFDDLFQFSNVDLWGDSPDSDKRVDGDGSIFGNVSDVGRFEKPQPSDTLTNDDRIIIPKTRPVKTKTERPKIVVIDDDFSTIDLMKIYLQREYDYVPFDNAREAIFYLNKNIPDLIFLDCYISLVRAKKMVEIIRSYPEYQDVPIYFLAEQDEKGALEAKIENEGFAQVNGILTRPVARGELQSVLDSVFGKAESA